MAGLSERVRAEVALFDRRYADWLEARARQQRAVNDAGIEAAEAELRDVEALLMTTPASVPGVFWRKLEVLELAIAQEDLGRTDRGEVWMLAAIKADILALGIGEERA